MPPVLAPVLAAGLGISTAAASTISGFILAGGSFLLQTLLAPKPPKPEDGKIAVRNPLPPRAYGAGRNRVAGSTIFLESTSKGHLYEIRALLSHECYQFVSYYLHEDEVTLATGGGVTQLDKKYGPSNVSILTRLGTVPETAYSEVTTDFPTLWPSTARGDGICSALLSCQDGSAKKQGKIYPFGKPELSCVLDCALVYDPRDAAQDPDDSSTWAWSDNPVLIILWHLCFNEFGMGRNYATAVLPNVAQWIIEANHCDEPVDLVAGGTEKRYRANVYATTDTDPKAAMAKMLATCDGWLCDRGDGGVDIRVGVYRTPTITLTDDDIVGFEINFGVPDEEVVNRLDVKFTDYRNKYTEGETDPWEDTADQTTRGAVRQQSYDLTWVHSWTQARRVAKREFARLRQPIRGTLDIRVSAINAAYDRWIQVTSDSIPQLGDQVIETRGGKMSLLAGVVRINFIATDSTIDDWTPATDEGQEPPAVDADGNIIVEPDPVSLPQPTVDTVTASEVLVGDTGVYSPTLIVTIDDPAHDSLGYRVEWSYTSGGSTVTDHQDFPGPQSPSGGSIVFMTGPVPATSSLSVVVYSIASDGVTLSDASDPPETVDTRLSSIAPQTVATDADFTLTVGTDAENIRHTGTLTADRAVTLSTTGAYANARFTVTRTGGGAFNLSIGGLKNLATNEWALVIYDGAAWYLAGSGSL